jgi:hypothetical protein
MPEPLHNAENTFAVQNWVAAGHLQKIQGKHMMTSQAENDETGVGWGEGFVARSGQNRVHAQTKLTHFV